MLDWIKHTPLHSHVFLFIIERDFRRMHLDRLTSQSLATSLAHASSPFRFGNSSLVSSLDCGIVVRNVFSLICELIEVGLRSWV